MDFREMMKTESKCIEEHAPQCQASCPLHLDMRGIIRLMKQEEYEEAAKLFQKQSFFPRLVGKLCTAPCQQGCKRGQIDETVRIHELEHFLVANQSFATEQLVPYLTMKHKVALVGGGMSSLAAAWYLYEKGFQLTVFEQTAQLGGKASRFAAVTPEDVAADLQVFAELPIQFRLNTEIGKDISYEQLLAEFDAVLVCGGANLQQLTEHGVIWQEDRPEIDGKTFQTANEKIFVSGSLLHPQEDYVIARSIADGRRAAISIDRYLKKVSLTAARKQEEPYETQLYTVTDGFASIPPVQPEGAVYTEAEALQEAGRCIDCRCMECVKQCKFLQKYEKYPRRYIREIANTISLLGGGLRSGRGLVMSCQLCGLCKEICPNGIPMAEICKSGREEMYKKNELPPAFYDFPVRDMLFSNSDEFRLCKHQPGLDKSKYLFFPGCQMAASTPDDIAPLYRHLTEKLSGGVGLFLGCCGAPADWSGRPEVFQSTMAELLQLWESMGKPIMIVGCTTCYQQFKGACPEMEVVSLWQVLADYGLPKAPHTHGNWKTITVHDPCTARHEPEIQEAVREILLMGEYETEELEYSREMTKCCGYGGLVFYGNRELALEAAKTRAAESDLPYVAYCSVCRDFLVKVGKPTFHILDVIFGRDNPEQSLKPGPNISQKEKNRILVKQKLLQEFWQETFAVAEDVPLYYEEALLSVLEDRLITLTNVRATILHGEETGNRFIRPADGHYFASYRPGIITYWVEYQPEGDGFRLYNAYSHRIQILDL